MSTPFGSAGQPRSTSVTRYNQRMAGRISRRAHLNEQGVAVAFTFNNLATMLTVGLLEDAVQLIPSVGDLAELLLSVLSFYWHRIVLVTDRHIFVYRDLPFHRPGKLLATYDRGPGVVRIGSDNKGWFSRIVRRGQLTFQDGTVVYHSPIWTRRAQYIAQEGNIPAGQ
ncbi:MAG TPA: hypothetical protein VHC43_01665 [Mycobacteriales bacterium]|nr:hypothetical protein [Mycobacteriales bacterium]